MERPKYSLAVAATDLDEVNVQLANLLAAGINDPSQMDHARKAAQIADVVAKNIAIQLKAHEMKGEIPVIKMLPKTSGIPITRGLRKINAPTE